VYKARLGAQKLFLMRDEFKPKRKKAAEPFNV
jgi:hypothetical protein